MLQPARRDARVAGDLLPGKAPLLDAPRGLHPGADGGRALLPVLSGQVGKLHRRHLDVQVDAVEQRAGHPRDVPLHRHLGAGAGDFGMAPVAAGAGVHRRHKHHRAGVGHPRRGPRDGDAVVLDGLAQHLQRLPLKFRQLIKKEHAVVRQRNLPRHRAGAAAGQARRRDGVVRRAEGAGVHNRVVGRQQPRHRIDAGGLDGLLKAELGQDGRQPLGQHALAGAGRADQQQVVPARRRNLQRALGKGLPAHVGHVLQKVVAPRQQQHRVKGHRGNLPLPLQAGAQLGDVLHRVNLQAVDNRGFLRVLGRQIEGAHAVLLGLERHRERAVDRPQLTGEAQLPHKGRILRRLPNLPGGSHHRQKDGQVKDRAGLFLACRRQVHRNFGDRQLVARMGQGRLHAGAGFLDGSVGQADDIKGGHGAGEGGLHRHRIGVDPADSIALDTAVQSASLRSFFLHYITQREHFPVGGPFPPAFSCAA